MKARAALAWAANKRLTIETIDIEGPRAGEVLVEVMATGICHTDQYRLSGMDSERLFPAILGHEGAGVGRGCDRRAAGRSCDSAPHARM